MSHIKYRADIDGLRALAVVPVVLFHCGLTVVSGGYVGVDVFFVISGFLITKAISSDLKDGSFSIAGFYERRIRRILPALIAMIAASFLASILFMDRGAIAGFGKSMISVALFVSNVFFWKASGYFEPSALTKPLLHTWSLAVEEQFYIIMPVFLGVCWRYAPRVLRPTIAIAAAGSLALSVAAMTAAPTAAFFLLPTRAWELLAGSLLALYPVNPLSRIVRELLGFAGLALVLAAVLLFDEATPFPGYAAAAPVLGAVAILMAGGAGGSVVSRILAWRPFVFVGLISYSLYLVHWPLIVFTRYALLRDPQGLEIVALAFGSVLLATLSWWFVEKPFRRPQNPVSRRRLFVVASLALISIAAVGFGMSRYSASGPIMSSDAKQATQSDTWLEGRCFLMDQPADAWAEDACVRTSGDKPRVVLWGDSFAAQYVPGLITRQADLDHDVVQYTYAGCPPILTYESYARPGCHAFNARILEVVSRYHADSVILAARWDQLRTRGLSGLPETIRRLREAGVTVYVIGQSPMFAFDVSVLESRKAGFAPDGRMAAWVTTFKTSEFDTVRESSAGAQFIDPMPAFCSLDRCRYRQDGQMLFFDYGHLSDFGSQYAVSTYFPIVRRSGLSEKPRRP